MPTIVIQRPSRKGFSPTARELRRFGEHVLGVYKPEAEVTIRIVSRDEITALNRDYRHKDKPTNVLSFRMEIPEGLVLSPIPIGDIVICAEIVNEEAAAQHKLPMSHWAHMVVHGVLHLLGFDHETDDEAFIMQSIEADLMQQMGFNNPYDTEDDTKYEK